MARLRTQKNSFVAGEVSVDGLPPADQAAFMDGARRLRNVIVRPSGAVSRRPGLRFVATAAGPGRLIGFEFNTEQVYLLVLTDLGLDVLAADGARLARLATPFARARLGQLAWTQSADTALFVHPEVPPQRLFRAADGRWLLADWTLAAAPGGRLAWPHHNFAAADVRLNASAATGNIVLQASADVFRAEHLGVRFRHNDREVTITGVLTPRIANAVVHQTLVAPFDTTDWSEQAWSRARGWPASVCFHQDRLVVGGSRDLPNRLWLSRSGALFDFGLGQGLDDDGIDFQLLSDQVNAIRHVVSGRHLQVFTAGGEWMVGGEPLTPTSIRLHLQTRIGVPLDRSVAPVDIDGATVFVARSGGQLRQFLFSDIERAYRAGDLALLARDLVRRPIDMDFDRAGRLLHVVLADGTLASVTLYREEGVTAWSKQETAGAFRAVAAVGERVFVLVERAGGHFIEAFDPLLGTDAAVAATRVPPTAAWTGLDHLEGERVTAVADGVPIASLPVVAGTVSLPVPAGHLEAGLPFTHVIEPLPLVGIPRDSRIRPIAITLRLLETAALHLDLGQGVGQVRLAGPGSGAMPAAAGAPQPVTGDRRLALTGWRPAGLAPIWRIAQDSPLPFTLLSVTVDIGTGD